MKKNLSLLLALALLAGCLSFAAPGLAEEAEAVQADWAEEAVEAADVEAEPEELPAEEAEAFDLMPPEGAQEPDATEADEAALDQDEQAPLPEPEEVEASAKAGESGGLSVNLSEIAIGVKEVYEGLSARVTDAGGSIVDDPVTWRVITGDAYIRLDTITGVITGVKKGEAVIEAVSNSGLSAGVTVRVLKAPASLTLTAPQTSLLPGGTVKLQAVLPADTASGRVRFESSNPAVATVDESGLVTALQKGAVTLRATAFNNKSATVALTVYGAPLSLTLEKDEYALVEGMRTRIAAVAQDADGEVTLVTPSLAIDPASQNPGCIALDTETGEVTALSRGQATVIATAGNLSATCLVKVVASAADMSLGVTALNLGVKETYAGLTPILIPQEGETDCQAIITWSSSNPRVVTVNSETGALTGLKAGSATVTARTHNGIERSVAVTVKKAPRAISLNPASVLLGPGATAQIQGVTDAKTASAGYTFSIDRPDVATVDSATGVITGVARGTATVTAVSFNGKRATCAVTVLNAPSSLQFRERTVALAGGMAYALEVDALDADGQPAMAGYAWSVDNPNVVSVDDQGVVTGLAGGSAVVTVACDGLSDSCVVNVVPGPADLTLSQTALTLGVKETCPGIDYALIPNPGDAECAAIVTWRSSNEKVVKVDADSGALTGVKAGSATITARTHNGIERSVKVTVKKGPSKLTLASNRLEMSVGMTTQLSPILPKNTASAHFNTKSSNPAVAEIDSQCVVTAHASGTATLTIAAFNGRSVTCALTVYGPPARISLSAERYKVVQDMSCQIVAEALDDAGLVTPASLSFSIDESSADPGCIRVDAKGIVTGLHKGSAVVRVTANEGLYALCPISVVAAPSALSLGVEEISIGIRQVYSGLSPVLTPPAGESDCEAVLTWSSSKPKVVKVDPDTGVITGLKTGTSVIKLTAHNGLSDSVTVRVVKAPTSITIDPAQVELSTGETYPLAPRSNTGAVGFSYSSSNPAVAVVDAATGLITAKAPGSAVITITNYNNRGTATFNVTVTRAAALTGEPVQVFLPETMSLGLGATLTLEATAMDEEGNEAPISSQFRVLEGASIVKVDDAGQVTGLSEGTAKIGVTTANGVSTHISVSTGARVETVCLVTVAAGVTRIEMPGELSLKTGETATIQPVLYNGKQVVSGGSYTLSVSGSAVSLGDNGLITALTGGTAVVTATASNGVSADCTVTVYTPRYRFFGAYEDYKSSSTTTLNFAQNNVESLWTVLSRASIDGATYTKQDILGNPSKSELLTGIAKAFADSQSTDVSVVYLCAHGYNYIDVKSSSSSTHYGIQLPGYEDYKSSASTYITAEEIFSAVNAIKGKVVLIIDSCFSGQFIVNMRSKLNAQNGRISVLTAADNTKANYYDPAHNAVAPDYKKAYDYFTYYLLMGMNYNMSTRKTQSGSGADANRDGSYTVSELFDYARSSVVQNLPLLIENEPDMMGKYSQSPQFYAGGNGDLVLFS